MKPDFHLKKYPRILFETAQNGECAKDVLTSLEFITSFWKQDAQFRSLVLSKRITREEKTKILSGILNKVCHPLAKEFINILIEKNIMNHVLYMKNIYKTEYKKIYRIVSVDAKVSHVMDDLEIKRLQDGIESNLHMSADLQVGVDPTLLGGIKMRIDNIYLDATVLGKMKRLRENLLQS
tara:strand:- start:3 stop:542 length:540 start_codon:yes stop_codon:yes gene_type:complete